MNQLILFAAAVLPSVLLFLFIWKKDPVKEPFSWLLKFFFWGVGICIPIAIVELVVQKVLIGGAGPTSLVGGIIMAFFVAAIPEEGGKLLILHNKLKKNPYFDEHFDGIVYAVCVGLGFATIENISYVFGEAENPGAVAAVRAILSVPGHYAFAVLMGYYYSLYIFVDRSEKNLLYAFLIPVIFHGIYDALLMIMPFVSEGVAVCSLLVLLVFCYRMHKYAYKRIQAQIQRDQMEEVEDTFERTNTTANNQETSFHFDSSDEPKNNMADLWH